MATRKPKAIYRPLLSAAWQTAWERKTLWVFGFFASIVTTGGVFELGFRALKRIETSRDLFENILAGSLPGYDTALEYLRIMTRIEPWRLTVIVILATLAAFVLAAVAVWSQGALLAGVSSKKPLSWQACLRHGRDRFWSLAVIAAVAKILTWVMLLVTTLPLVLFVATGTTQSALLYFATFLVFFPAIILISIINNLAVVSAIRRKHSGLHAIHDAVDLLRSHWLATLEVGVALFITSSLLTFAGLVATGIATAIGTAVIVGALLFGSGMVYFLGVGIAVLSIGFTAMAAHGLITAFQFGVWVGFYDKASKTGIIAKLERWWQGW